MRGRGSRGPRLQPSGWRSDSQLGVRVRDARGGDAPHPPEGTLVVPRLQAMSRAYKEPLSRDFSGGPVAKTPHSQHRGPGFSSWWSQVPYAATKGLYATTKDPVCAVKTE